MVMTVTAGVDWLLRDAPGLLPAPLSLLDLTRPLIDVPQAVAARQQAFEKLASAQAAADMISAERDFAVAEADLADAQRWERGFQYLPELGNAEAMELFVPDSGTTKSTVATQTATAWYDPFTVVGRDDRSTFGFPGTSFDDRAKRAQRALLAHEAWRCEREFWTGEGIPTNYHLTASPGTATTSPHRTIPAWSNPTAAPTTVLGTAVSLRDSLPALDQAIANSDAGVGMIHATPYVVQLWASLFPFLRDTVGRIYTVNFNLIIPGYGYPGTGPDTASRTVADGVTNSTTTVTSATAAFTSNDVGRPISGAGIPSGTVIKTVSNGTTVLLSAAATASATGVSITVSGSGGDATGSTQQWAYATDAVYHLNGAVNTYPWDIRQGAPEVTVDDSIEVRAERQHALITNRLLRAAVLVDTANVT